MKKISRIVLKVLEFPSHGMFDEEKRNQLLALVSKNECPEKKKILDYLKNGHLYAVLWGFSYDRVMKGQPRVPLPARMFTDGVWAWSAEITYHLERYNLQLPKEFLLHMEGLDWQVPPFENTNNIVLGGPENIWPGFKNNPRPSQS